MITFLVVVSLLGCKLQQVCQIIVFAYKWAIVVLIIKGLVLGRWRIGNNSKITEKYVINKIPTVKPERMFVFFA